MKKDFGPFSWLQVGDWTILARLKKGIRMLHHATGEPTSWVEVGGLRLRSDKKKGRLLAVPGTYSIDMDKAQPAQVTASPLMHGWLVAGAKIGESFISYDKQPKMRGPRNCPILMRRIKRREDFDEAVELWHSWLKWRESGSVDRFEVFHLGPLEKYTAGKKLSDADAAARLYEARCRAIGSRLKGEYGLSLHRNPQAATTNTMKFLGLSKPTPKKFKKTKT